MEVIIDMARILGILPQDQGVVLRNMVIGEITVAGSLTNMANVLAKDANLITGVLIVGHGTMD